MRAVLWPAAVLMAGLLPCSGVRAAPAPDARPADPGMAEDVQDLLFFGATRPVLIRLHVLVDGKPHARRWDAYLASWFRFLDRDGDGSLDREEAARAPAAQGLQLLQANPSYYYLNLAPPFDELDRDHDRRVSPAEFLRYYRASPAGPVQVAALGNGFNPAVPGEDNLTEAMFGALDADRDGRLSREELAAAESALRRYDQDDDELITARELLPAGAVQALQAGSAYQMRQRQTVPLLLVQKEDAPRRIGQRMRVARAVLARYDRDGNGRLGRDEVAMSREQFDRLDTSKDGELDELELVRWVIVTPDVEAVVRLGETGRADLVEVVAGRGRPDSALRRTAANTLAFTTDDTCIHLVRAPGLGGANPSVRRALLQQFKAADSTGKGFVTKAQVEGPRGTFLRTVLAVADRDGDGKLTEQELNAWFDLVGSGAGCQVTVTLLDGARGLFQILDANQDGRLSIRELRGAAARLAAYDRGKGGISRKDLPLQYRVVINTGPANYALAQPLAPLPRDSARAPAPAPRAPVWFRKMDRNGDGDVSPREFLGTREDFRKLDTDGDGLISLAEALAADAALRKK